MWIAKGSPDDQIGEAVSVDIAGIGYRAAAEVERRHAVQAEAVRAI